MSLLTPSAARVHFGLLLVLRVTSGVGGGVLLPAVHALIARWSTPKYLSFVVSAMFTGIDAGIVVGMLVSGVLSDYGFAGGWPSVFYVFGVVGCVWSTAWFLLCYDSPSVHPRMSSAERDYWRSAVGTVNLVARPPTPWRKILTSLPVWALAVAYFANLWGYYTLVSCVPLFMHDVLGFNMTKNGLLSALLLMSGGFVIPFALLSDWLRSPGRLSTNVVRKASCVIGSVSTACMFILAGYTGCNRALAVTVMFTASACISYPLVSVNQLDLAPLHAGKIMGLTHFVGSLGSIAAPHAVGALTYRRSSRAEWQHVFYVAAGVLTVGAVVFVIFGSGERQSWAKRAESDGHDEPTTVCQPEKLAMIEQTV